MPFLVILGIVVILTLSAAASASIVARSKTNAISTIHYSTHPTNPPIGSPAIPVTRPGQIPAFTAQDVQAYFHLHPFNGQANETRITRLLFITNAQAQVLMKGEQTGLADPNALVCYVEFRGPFTLVAPHPYGASDPVVQVGQVVFDASNGYGLVGGGI